MVKIMRNMAMYNKFKYFGKIIKNGNRSVITTRGIIAFFKKQKQELPASIEEEIYAVIS
jgi:hypothetical protein